MTSQGIRSRTRANRAGSVATIIFNLIFLYIVNNLLGWGVPFLTESFSVALWMINLSVLGTIVGHFLLLIYAGSWFRHLLTVGMNALGFAATCTLLVIFPFSFDGDIWATVVRVVLVLVLVGMAIGALVELIRLVFARD